MWFWLYVTALGLFSFAVAIFNPGGY